MNLRLAGVALPRFATLEPLIETMRPDDPVCVLFPEKFRSPGDALPNFPVTPRFRRRLFETEFGAISC